MVQWIGHLPSKQEDTGSSPVGETISAEYLKLSIFRYQIPNGDSDIIQEY